MPIGICAECGKPCPDSFHNFQVICNCKTKEEWIAYYKKNNWNLELNGKEYNFLK